MMEGIVEEWMGGGWGRGRRKGRRLASEEVEERWKGEERGEEFSDFAFSFVDSALEGEEALRENEGATAERKQRRKRGEGKSGKVDGLDDEAEEVE
jgi:hypothetical protein